jgi:hypothetical protein
VKVPITSTTLKITLTAETRLAEEQALLEEETLNEENFLSYRAGNRRKTIS